VIADKEEMVGGNEVTGDGGGGCFGAAAEVLSEKCRCKRGKKRGPVGLGVDDGELVGARRLVGKKINNERGIRFAILGGDVADAVGFENAQHLSRCYNKTLKECVGMHLLLAMNGVHVPEVVDAAAGCIKLLQYTSAGEDGTIHQSVTIKHRTNDDLPA
jgi:hypothetical protein